MTEKQWNSKKQDTFGKGNVTRQQVAFIVDRYLCDNNFSSTRSTFRNEASSLISHSPIHQAPKSLLTLGEMLDEYACLKEQKAMMDQENTRIQMFWQGMNNIMSAYNATRNLPHPINSSVSLVPQPQFSNASHPGVPRTTHVPNKLNTNTLPRSNNSNTGGGNVTTSVMNVSGRKRKDTQLVDAPLAAKKSCSRSSSRKIPAQGQNTLQQSDNANNNHVVAMPSSAVQSSPENCEPIGSQIQGSGVSKRFFSQSLVSAPSNSSVRKTPPRATSRTDTHISPSGIFSVGTPNHDAAATRCAVTSTKRVMVSPAK